MSGSRTSSSGGDGTAPRRQRVAPLFGVSQTSSQQLSSITASSLPSRGRGGYPLPTGPRESSPEPLVSRGDSSISARSLPSRASLVRLPVRQRAAPAPAEPEEPILAQEGIPAPSRSRVPRLPLRQRPAPEGISVGESLPPSSEAITSGISTVPPIPPPVRRRQGTQTEEKTLITSQSLPSRPRVSASALPGPTSSTVSTTLSTALPPSKSQESSTPAIPSILSSTAAPFVPSRPLGGETKRAASRTKTEGSKKDIVWLSGLRAYVLSLLAHIIPDENLREKLVSVEAGKGGESNMRIWAMAFTHETYDLEFNYEKLEFLGDKVLGAAYSKYLQEILPDDTNAFYTELVRAALNTKRNGDRASTHGMSVHIRRDQNIQHPINVFGDVFESFFGALSKVGDRIVDGLGFVLCYNMVVYFFKDERIETDEKYGHKKTQFQQIFSRTDIGNPDVRTDPQESGWVTEIYISPSIVDSLYQKYGDEVKKRITLRSGVLAKAYGNTEKASQNKAYVNAFDALKQMGLTRAFAESIKKIRDFGETKMVQFRQENKAAYDQEIKRVGLDPNTNLFFHNSRKMISSSEDVEKRTEILAAIKGGRKIILTIGHGVTAEDARFNAMKLFIEGKWRLPSE